MNSIDRNAVIVLIGLIATGVGLSFMKSETLFGHGKQFAMGTRCEVAENLLEGIKIEIDKAQTKGDKLKALSQIVKQHPVDDVWHQPYAYAIDGDTLIFRSSVAEEKCKSFKKGGARTIRLVQAKPSNR